MKCHSIRGVNDIANGVRKFHLCLIRVLLILASSGHIQRETILFTANFYVLAVMQAFRFTRQIKCNSLKQKQPSSLKIDGFRC